MSTKKIAGFESKNGNPVMENGQTTVPNTKDTVFESLFGQLPNKMELIKELDLKMTKEEIKDAKIQRFPLDNPKDGVIFTINDFTILFVAAPDYDPTMMGLRIMQASKAALNKFMYERDENGRRIRNEYSSVKIDLPPVNIFGIDPFAKQAAEDENAINEKKYVDLIGSKDSGIWVAADMIHAADPNNPLNQYSRFLQEVNRIYQDYDRLGEAAFQELFDSCMEKHILENYLNEHWDEVKSILMKYCPHK